MLHQPVGSGFPGQRIQGLGKGLRLAAREFLRRAQAFGRLLPLRDVGRNAAGESRLSLRIETEHSALVNPPYGAARLDDAILKVVITDILAGDPPSEGGGDAFTVFRMNRLRPQARILVKLPNRKAPDAFKTRAHIQNPFWLQGREPNHFRDLVSHPPKAFLALP